MVASKQLKFAIEMDVERKARLEKMVATTHLRLALETEEERRAKKGMNLISILQGMFMYVCMYVSLYVCIPKKWFPLQGERAQSLKVFNVHMLGFKNKIEIRKRRQNKTCQFTTR